MATSRERFVGKKINLYASIKPPQIAWQQLIKKINKLEIYLGNVEFLQKMATV